MPHSFRFVKAIQELSASGFFFVSSFIVSLFTNVPLKDTINIRADVLYSGHLSTFQFPENIFKNLMLVATEGVECNYM